MITSVLLIGWLENVLCAYLLTADFHFIFEGLPIFELECDLCVPKEIKCSDTVFVCPYLQAEPNSNNDRG